MELIFSILIGIAAGFLAGKLTKGSGFGWLGNLIVGALGALIGSFLFIWLGIAAAGIALRLLAATAGAIVLLILLSVATRKKRA
jgi:uncharacterized membrane protein YeaQ/YmgE (transglycosylase-associated protein family)